VKIDNLTNGLVAALLLASPIVGAETEYPAADFKPKVIYQDTTASSQSKPAAAAPTKQEKAVEVDSKYPAADFEPKVLYKDQNYKPSKLVEVPSTSGSASAPVDSVQAIENVAKAEDQSMTSYLLGLVVLAVLGYIFFGKRDQSKVKSSDYPVYSKHVSGLSGVARYIRKHNMAAVTGVARYLENQVASAKEATPVSGVEKYLEKQAKSAKEQAATGVEKYMRNRG